MPCGSLRRLAIPPPPRSAPLVEIVLVDQNRIRAEAQRPRCDVFWNNEILNTLRLEKRGLLTAYVPPTAAEFPAHPFAVRLRYRAARLALEDAELRARATDDASLVEAAGGTVVMVEGELKPAEYRHFRIQRQGDQPWQDDFSALYQTISRRLRRAKDEQEEAARWRVPGSRCAIPCGGNRCLRSRA